MPRHRESGSASRRLYAGGWGHPPRGVRPPLTCPFADRYLGTGSSLTSGNGSGAIKVVGQSSIVSDATVSPTPVYGSQYSMSDPLSSLAVPLVGTDTPSTPDTPSTGWPTGYTAGTTGRCKRQSCWKRQHPRQDFHCRQAHH